VSLHRSSDEQPVKIAPPFRTLHLRYPVETSAKLSPKASKRHPTMPAFQLDPDQINDLLSYLKSSNKSVTAASCLPYRVCTSSDDIFASRPNASLNAATAAGGSTLSNFWLASNRRDAITFRSCRQSSPIIRSQPSALNPPRSGMPGIDQKLEVRLSAIGAQRRVGNIIILKASISLACSSFGMASPEKIANPGTSFAARTAFAVSRALRRGRSGIPIVLDGLARRFRFCGARKS